MAAVGVVAGVRWHALFGDEVDAEVVSIEVVRRDNTDGGTREDNMPRVRFERAGTSREVVVSNEYVFANVRAGDRVTVWVRGDEVVVRGTGNDALRGALVGVAGGTLTYLGAALLTLVLERRRLISNVKSTRA